MSSDDNLSAERDVREKIMSLMQSIGQAPTKQITAAELQELKTAASRLDQMLKAVGDADLQALRSAAARLDQLLLEIRAGKDVSGDLKRRPEWQNRDGQNRDGQNTDE